MIRYHEFSTLAAAQACVAAIRASGRRAYLLTMRSDFHEVREIV